MQRNFSLQNKPYRISSLCCQPLTRVPRPYGEVWFAHTQDRGSQAGEALVLIFCIL